MRRDMAADSDRDWRPTASFRRLRERARLVQRLRDFFTGRGFWEAETPLLGHAGATDLHIESMMTRCVADPAPLYLQTSPEYAMKRLLAAGSGPIFQICKAFRDEPPGRMHNPEFTLLEWYRPDTDHHALMDETDALIGDVLGLAAARRLRYGDVFSEFAGLDPFTVPTAVLREHACALHVRRSVATDLDRDACLGLIMSRCVQPALPREAVLIFDYPASQAALARVRASDPPVAERFELFVDGVELANGYHELTDPVEQRERFERDRTARRTRGLHVPDIDEALLGALASGMPESAGVALGVDRLVLLAAGAGVLEDVISFKVTRA